MPHIVMTLRFVEPVSHFDKGKLENARRFSGVTRTLDGSSVRKFIAMGGLGQWGVFRAISLLPIQILLLERLFLDRLSNWFFRYWLVGIGICSS